ncbi:FecR family protein [Dongia deserti]|uniref:FecR family protein n=1 Tax=Dongia deserti TaxID=2268030 RepID=UPI0013C4A32D|nr:FecR family protein [Dongia deserti]
MKGRLAYQLCYVIAAVAAFGGSAEATGIATVADVVNEGYRTPPGAKERTANRADELVQDEALRTDDDSSIRVKFVDGSELNMEAESELVLSDYVFDGAASKGLINLNDGLFHFTSNGQPDQGVKLRTPVATIGVRGTEFLVHVDDDDATIIDILSGAVEAQPNGAGKSVVCVAGQSILVAGADDDAICGDLGSFSSAAANPGPKRREPSHGGQDRDRPQRDLPDFGRDEGGEDGGEGSGGEGSGSGAMFLIEDETIALA